MVSVLSGQGVGSTRLTPEPDLDHVSTDAPAPGAGSSLRIDQRSAADDENWILTFAVEC